MGIEPSKHCEHRCQTWFAFLQCAFDGVENSLLASGQAHLITRLFVAPIIVRCHHPDRGIPARSLLPWAATER